MLVLGKLFDISKQILRDTPERIAESALAHRLKDASEAAYQRGDLIEKRQALMTNWANYCYPTKDKVVQLHG